MSASSAQRAATADRRRKAVAMRIAGVDWVTIAERLKYASKAAACKDVTRALEVSLAEASRNAAMLRHLELLRLDRLQTGLWTAAASGDPKSVTAALGIIDRRIKLLGLDSVPSGTEAVRSALGELAAALGVAADALGTDPDAVTIAGDGYQSPADDDDPADPDPNTGPGAD